MTCPQSPGHGLGSGAFGNGWGGGRELGRSQSYLWALTVGIILRNDVHALSRMDKAWKACNLPLGRSCFTSVFLIILSSQWTQSAGVLHGYKHAQAVVGSIFFHGDFEWAPGAYLLSGIIHVFLKDLFPCKFLAGKGSSELHQRTREYWNILNLSRDNFYPVLSRFLFFLQLQSRGRCPPRMKQEDRNIKT